MATSKVKQIKRRIGTPIDQKRPNKTQALTKKTHRKIYQVVEVEDTPSMRVMIRKVHHLVEVVK